MATISENLQILKDSTDAIKQAIIDKGGTINGDITTWASAISGISGGGSSSGEEITFTGALETDFSMVGINGNLNKLPDDCLDTYYTCIVGYSGNMGFNTPYQMSYNAPNLNISEELEFDGIMASASEAQSRLILIPEDVVIIAIILMWQDSSGVWKSTLVKPIIQYDI